MSAFSPAKPVAMIEVSPPDRKRRVDGLSYSTQKFAAQSITISCSWGLQPAVATIVYIGDVPVTIGQVMKVSCAGHTFWGICRSDIPVVGAGGKTRTLEFVDYREYLADWDECFCCFNKKDDSTNSGSRVRGYYHVTPSNFKDGRRTYTNSPLSAADIIELLRQSSSAPWQIFHCDPTTGIQTPGYHPSLVNFPAYDIDCMNGKKVGAAIQECCDQHGLVMTLMDGPFNLTFARKGEGPIPDFPALSDDRKDGRTLSRVATRVSILGDRNIYQVHNVEMISDWAPGWVQFWDTSKLQDYVFNNFQTHGDLRGIPRGTPYKAIPGDIENAIGRQLALARSLELTVAEFAAHRSTVHSDGNDFRDFRMFNGKSRMQMPAALYIRMVLFRAFRISSGFQLRNARGQFVGPDSVEIVPRLLAEVTHDPVTGKMFWDLDKPGDGPGYAIIQGYQVGQDGFKTIRPEHFNLGQWIDVQNIWQHVPFQVDDSGTRDGKFIIFDEPVIRSADLITAGLTDEEKEEFNGYSGLNANPTFQTPRVMAALCFAAERFMGTIGFGAKTQVVNLPGLNEEFVGNPTGGWTVNPYSDGKTGTQKALEIANATLARQFTYRHGGYRRIVQPNPDGTFAPGTKLTGIIDRVTIRSSPQGIIEEVDLTGERTWNGFEPDRTFERRQRDANLFPGQKQLQEEVNQHRTIAAAMRSSPQTVRDMASALYGNLKEVTAKES